MGTRCEVGLPTSLNTLASELIVTLKTKLWPPGSRGVHSWMGRVDVGMVGTLQHVCVVELKSQVMGFRGGRSGRVAIEYRY